MHEKSLPFNLFFILYFFLWHCSSWEASEHHTLWKILLKFFSSSGCLHVKNVIQSFYQEICVIKAFLAIIQKQEFPQIFDLYSKIDNNINFYLSMFPTKINDKIFQNKGKILFCGHFWAYFVVFAQREFFLKNPA